MRSIAWLSPVSRRLRKESSNHLLPLLSARVLRLFFPDWPALSTRAASKPFTIRLGRDGIIQLGERCGVRQLRVRRGVLWLTGTPADHDIVLRAGDRYCLAGRWPFVLQAMQDAEVDLQP